MLLTRFDKKNVKITSFLLIQTRIFILAITSVVWTVKRKQANQFKKNIYWVLLQIISNLVGGENSPLSVPLSSLQFCRVW